MGTHYAYEERVNTVFCETIADISAPTVSEINAGTDLTAFITKDGLDLSGDQNMVDNAMIHESHDSQVVGSWRINPKLKMARESPIADDEAWDLSIYGTTGYLVVRRGLAYDTAFAAAQKVEVYPCQMHQPIMSPSATNTLQTFSLALAATAQPNLKATVSAS